MKININARAIYIGILACTAILLAMIAYYAFAPASDKEETQYLLIDNDDNIDSVYHKLSQIAPKRGVQTFRTMARHLHYDKHVRTGRYAVEKGERAISLLRTLRNGQQTPMRLVIKEVRTIEDLAADLGTKLMADSTMIDNMLRDESCHNKYGLDSANIITLFIPNTYEVYWDTAVGNLLDRMNKEKKRFWNDERKAKAAKLNMTAEQVMTLASIVDEETANNAEKPVIARLYYNRLNLHMPLQADPTVKYASRQHDARRVRGKMLQADSPYNTYRHTGLPPGPIKIASVVGIDAVLNMPEHDYLYMCAKEDFSGTHNFARTHAEHQQNAARYIAALNARGIK